MKTTKNNNEKARNKVRKAPKRVVLRAISNSENTLLPTELTIHTAEQVAAEWKTLPIQPGQLVLDASRLENITTPGVQLLLSLEASLQAAGGSLRVVHPRSEHAHLFDILGLGAKWQEWAEGTSKIMETEI